MGRKLKSRWQRARELRRTAEYQRARAAFLAENPLCRPCRRDGRTRAATELDHIKPAHLLKTDADFFNQRNWQPICYWCHRAKTQAENEARVPRERWPEDIRAWQSWLKHG